MTAFMEGYVRRVEAFNYRVGRFAMYLIFLMIGILAWSSISKTFFLPSLWTLEMAQFTMMAYFILGGAYSIQLGSNVRMDLLYGGWSDRRKAIFDAVTVLFLLFYLGVLLYGGWLSTAYSIEYGERTRTAWRPYMWPIKVDHDGRHLADAAAGTGGALPRHPQAAGPRDPAPSRARRRLCGARRGDAVDVLRRHRDPDVLVDDGHADDRPAGVRRDRLRGDGGGDPALRHRRVRLRLLGPDEGDGVVPAADAADVHLHGLRPEREPHRRRPLQDVPRLDGGPRRRPRHRHHRPHGADLGDERPLRRRHGDRRHHRAAGAAAPRLRQAHGDGGDPGGIVAGDPGAAVGGPRPLRDDRAPTRRSTLARGRRPGSDDGDALRHLHRGPLPLAATSRPAAFGGGARRRLAGEAAPPARRPAAARHLLRNDGAVRERLDQPRRNLPPSAR